MAKMQGGGERKWEGDTKKRDAFRVEDAFSVTHAFGVNDAFRVEDASCLRHAFGVNDAFRVEDASCLRHAFGVEDAFRLNRALRVQDAFRVTRAFGVTRAFRVTRAFGVTRAFRVNRAFRVTRAFGVTRSFRVTRAFVPVDGYNSSQCGPVPGPADETLPNAAWPSPWLESTSVRVAAPFVSLRLLVSVPQPWGTLNAVLVHPDNCTNSTVAIQSSEPAGCFFGTVWQATVGLTCSCRDCGALVLLLRSSCANEASLTIDIPFSALNYTTAGAEALITYWGVDIANNEIWSTIEFLTGFHTSLWPWPVDPAPGDGLFWGRGDLATVGLCQPDVVSCTQR
eukprot:g3432.t1